MKTIKTKMSLEQRSKISKALIKAIAEGRFFSEKHRKKISESKKGKKMTEEHKNKLKLFQVGTIPWNKGLKLGKNLEHSSRMKGRKMSQETKEKISIALSGKNNPRWTGKYTESYLARRKFKKEMQKLIFERDDYTCQLCGVRGVDLQVDHIQSWAEYVELRFSMDNCRTLCAKCHYKITFGKPMPDNIKGWGHNLLKGGEVL